MPNPERNPAATPLLKRFDQRYIRPWARKLWPWRRVVVGGVRVRYTRRIDGGGAGFGQEFIPFLRGRGMPVQERVFEWCSGPAFIGFSMLGQGLCRTLCLADINPRAVEACRRTVRENGMGDRVTVYQSDNLNAIPRTEQWDLVVSNPPHFVDEFAGDIRAHDPDWRIHREFFGSVGTFLKPGGIIVLQENNRGSTVETFRSMIDDAGLSILFVEGGAPTRTPTDRFYFIGIGRRGDVHPAWATGRPG
jgi:SAM-dependent methyltransferase